MIELRTRVRESMCAGKPKWFRIIGGDGLAFDPAHYGSQIALAAADFRSLLPSEMAGSAIEYNADLAALSTEAMGFIDSGASILIAPTELVPVLETAAGENEIGKAGDRTAGLVRSIVRSMQVSLNAGKNKAIALLAAMGPVEPLLSLSEITESELFTAYAARAAILKELGVDGLICRSFTELDALNIAIRAALETGLTVIGSMTFDSGPDYTQTVLGITIPQMCKSLADAGVVMVGCDSSEFPDGAPAIVTMLRETCSLPIYIEISAGRAELGDDGVHYPEGPKEFAERLEPLTFAGAGIIGGGRGATVGHLAEMAKVAARLEKRRRDKRN